MFGPYCLNNFPFLMSSGYSSLLPTRLTSLFLDASLPLHTGINNCQADSSHHPDLEPVYLRNNSDGHVRPMTKVWWTGFSFVWDKHRSVVVSLFFFFGFPLNWLLFKFRGPSISRVRCLFRSERLGEIWNHSRTQLQTHTRTHTRPSTKITCFLGPFLGTWRLETNSVVPNRTVPVSVLQCNTLNGPSFTERIPEQWATLISMCTSVSVNWDVSVGYDQISQQVRSGVR